MHIETIPVLSRRRPDIKKVKLFLAFPHFFICGSQDGQDRGGTCSDSVYIAAINEGKLLVYGVSQCSQGEKNFFSGSAVPQDMPSRCQALDTGPHI